MPRDSAAADRPASYLVGTAAAFPLFFRDRTKPINQLPFSPSAKFPKSGSSCESRVRLTEVGPGELGGIELSTAHVGFGEARALQHCVGHQGELHIGLGEAGASRLAETRFAPL